MSGNDPPLRLGPQTVGAIHYVLRTSEGDELERVEPGAPLRFLFGSGALLPGLEEALAGSAAGDALRVSVPPEKGFGNGDPSKVHRVSRAAFPEGTPPPVGTQMGATGPDGHPVTFWVTAVEGDEVVVNENHPLCGVELVYELVVSGVRPATETEQREGRLATSGDGADAPHE